MHVIISKFTVYTSLVLKIWIWLFLIQIYREQRFWGFENNRYTMDIKHYTQYQLSFLHFTQCKSNFTFEISFY